MGREKERREVKLWETWCRKKADRGRIGKIIAVYRWGGGGCNPPKNERMKIWSTRRRIFQRVLQTYYAPTCTLGLTAGYILNTVIGGNISDGSSKLKLNNHSLISLKHSLSLTQIYWRNENPGCQKNKLEGWKKKSCRQPRGLQLQWRVVFGKKTK